MTDPRYVMFLDLLGFSQLVSNNEPQELRKIYDSEIRQTVGACSLLAAATFGSNTNFRVVSKQSGVLVDVEQGSINFHMMSDSLIAWTNDLTVKALTEICRFAATYLSMTFALGLPHRGAISMGNIQLIELPLNGKLQANAVGSGVVNAYKFEAGQEWMGCVVDPVCLEKLSNTETSDFFAVSQCPVVRCSPPYKDSAKFRSDLAINWTLFSAPLRNDITFFEEQFSRRNKGTEGSSSGKARNTYEFFRKFAQEKR